LQLSPELPEWQYRWVVAFGC
jgi:hypothetical protein